MARKSDYFGLSYLVSVILAIIPVTAFVCGFITRILDGKILAAILRGPRLEHHLAHRPDPDDRQQAHPAHHPHLTVTPKTTKSTGQRSRAFSVLFPKRVCARGRRAAYAPPRKDHCSFCARRMHSSCPLISFSPSARTAGRYTPSSQRCIAFTLSESMSSR